MSKAINLEKAIELVEMIRREIPKTLGEFNLQLLYNDIVKVEKLLKASR